jgi:UDP-2,3-diacylglucosamine pyrophosphatase LpxH
MRGIRLLYRKHKYSFGYGYQVTRVCLGYTHPFAYKKMHLFMQTRISMCSFKKTIQQRYYKVKRDIQQQVALR